MCAALSAGPGAGSRGREVAKADAKQGLRADQEEALRQHSPRSLDLSEHRLQVRTPARPDRCEPLRGRQEAPREGREAARVPIAAGARGTTGPPTRQPPSLWAAGTVRCAHRTARGRACGADRGPRHEHRQDSERGPSGALSAPGEGRMGDGHAQDRSGQTHGATPPSAKRRSRGLSRRTPKLGRTRTPLCGHGAPPGARATLADWTTTVSSMSARSSGTTSSPH